MTRTRDVHDAVRSSSGWFPAENVTPGTDTVFSRIAHVGHVDRTSTGTGCSGVEEVNYIVALSVDVCRYRKKTQSMRYDEGLGLLVSLPRLSFLVLRSVAANSYDQIYCMQLAQNAVHGAMAGYTAFSAGMVNDRTVSSSSELSRLQSAPV